MLRASAQQPPVAYVQYGCGTDAPPGWLNFDASPTLRLQRIPLLAVLGRRVGPRFPDAVRVGDIRRGLPVAPSSCRGIYASHVLEHLALADLRSALAHTYSHLAPGGTFRLVVPDLERLAREYTSSSDPAASITFLREARLGSERRARGLAFLRGWFGNEQHLWMWDFPSLELELTSAGFTDVRRAVLGDSEDPRFAEVESPSRWVGCLGIECRRPVDPA